MAVGPEKFRPSLQILLRLAQGSVPSHLNYANRTFSQAQNLMNSIPQGASAMPDGSFMGSTSGRLPNQTGNSEFSRLVSAIAAKESGGNYRAVNRSSGALGRYQIMPSNLPSWSKKFVGRVVSRNEFLNNPNIQEAIARGQLMEYYKRYGAAGAATAWYAGPGAVNRKMGSTRNQGAYPSIQEYWKDILRRMG